MNLFEKQNKPFAIKLSERVKEEIKKTFNTDWYDNANESEYFNYPNYEDLKGFKKLNHTSQELLGDYNLITEAEFFGDGNNKLREKFRMLIPDDFGGMDKVLAEQCEQITDDFADKFVEWVIINYPNQRKNLLKQGNLRGFYTTTQLIQIFKTQHYE